MIMEEKIPSDWCGGIRFRVSGHGIAGGIRDVG